AAVEPTLLQKHIVAGLWRGSAKTGKQDIVGGNRIYGAALKREKRLRPTLKGLDGSFWLCLWNFLHRTGPGIDAYALAGKICQRSDAAALLNKEGLRGIEIGNGEINDPVPRSVVANRRDEQIDPFLLQQLHAVGSLYRLELNLHAKSFCYVGDQVDLEAA